MTIESGGTAPYAPAAAVIGVIERYRKTGLAGQPVDAATLERVGVQGSLVKRTLASLRTLDLIDGDGQPSEQFKVLKNAPATEFGDRLAEWLRSTYAPIFGFCDPSTASATEIDDAFRGYTPEGQRARMTTLFTGLCAHAGIVDQVPPKPRGRNAETARKKRPVTTTPAAPREAAPQPRVEQVVSRPSELLSAREKYAELLLQRLADGDDNAELLDRIERALGIRTE